MGSLSGSIGTQVTLEPEAREELGPATGISSPRLRVQDDTMFIVL